MQVVKNIIVTAVIIIFCLSSTGICGGIKPGKEMKIITTDGERYQGLLVSMDSQSYTVSSKWGNKRIDRADVAQMWKGKPATITGGALGLFAGVAGGFIYYLVDRNSGPDGYPFDYGYGYSCVSKPRPLGYYTNTIIGFSAAGLLMGGCIGSLFTEWSPIDKEEFAVDAGPMDGNGLCMQISFRF